FRPRLTSGNPVNQRERRLSRRVIRSRLAAFAFRFADSNQQISRTLCGADADLEACRLPIAARPLPGYPRHTSVERLRKKMRRRPKLTGVATCATIARFWPRRFKKNSDK